MDELLQVDCVTCATLGRVVERDVRRRLFRRLEETVGVADEVAVAELVDVLLDGDVVDVDEVGDGLRDVDAHGEEEGDDGDGGALQLVLLQDAELLQVEMLQRAVDDDGEDQLVVHYVRLRRETHTEL